MVEQLMSIDWTTLSKKTNEYCTLELTKDPKTDAVTEIIYSGLQVKLSDLAEHFTFGGGTLLAIWVDTLIVDYPTFDAQGVVITARNIDVKQFSGTAIPVRTPAVGDTAILEFLINESVDNVEFNLTTTSSQKGTTEFTVPVGSDPLRTAYFTVKSDGSSSHNTTTDPTQIQDLLGRPWALNSLKASFTAATLLMSSSEQEDVTVARSMLSWVVTCIRSMGEKGATIPTSYAELYSQAAALLVTLNLSPGAYYVPVLSASYYKDQANQLISALQSYENNLNTLDVKDDIHTAIENVSSTLEGIAQDEEQPLQAELSNIKTNITDLASSINTLRNQFNIQYYDVDVRLGIMNYKIADAQVTQYLEASFKFAVDVTKAGVAVGQIAGGDASAIGELMENLASGVNDGMAAVDAITKDFPNSNLPEQAKNLMLMQQQLMISFDASTQLWDQIQKDKALSELPKSLAAVVVDPSLAWDNFMVEADATLTNLSRLIGDGSGSGAAQDAATNYLASLKILAQYGKAINAKFIAYSTQLTEATIVKSQITAANRTQTRWKELESNSKTEQEKLAALKGLIKLRTNTITRSIFTAWTYYRNSYFYLYFKKPSTVISTDMNAAQLKNAFAEVTAWTNKLLGDGIGGEQIQLPNDNVPISFKFNIVKQSSDPAPAGVDTALIVPASDGQPAVITLSIPSGDPQLQGVLPDKGNVAIWVKEAQFFINGVKPNSKGNVMMNISTSGSYENGFGPGNAYSFVTKGFESEYGYVFNTQDPYIKWQVNTAVYMTPSPFTQWTLTFDPLGGDPSDAKTLQMDLVVAFRKKA